MVKKGFTLIELLIVIAVVAILSGITLSVINVTRVRDRAQDSVRREDIGSTAGALERYYADNNSYPIAAAGNLSVISPTVVPNYIKVLPDDVTAPAAHYTYWSDGQKYCICTTLKAENPADRKSCAVALGGNYCIVNPF